MASMMLFAATIRTHPFADRWGGSPWVLDERLSVGPKRRKTMAHHSAGRQLALDRIMWDGEGYGRTLICGSGACCATLRGGESVGRLLPMNA